MPQYRRFTLFLCGALAHPMVGGDGPKPATPSAKTAAKGKGTRPAALAPRPLPTRVASVEGITEYRLTNGLRVLLFPDASKPTCLLYTSRCV